MSYYDNPQNVASYIKMAEGYDGQVLIDVLKRYLSSGKTVLELGMGPGKDLALLADSFVVTGSDSSPIFVDRYRQQHPDSDVMQLDAVKMNTDRQFDAIYSNKVLYHLTRDELQRSFEQQAQVLKPHGLALHSFWYGDQSEEAHGLHFEYYTEESLANTIGHEFEWLESVRYAEMEEDDSFYIVLRKRE